MRHPENLIAYQTPLAYRGAAKARLEALTALAAGQVATSAARDLAARRKLLGWQVRLEKADADFAAQRYEDALAAYEQVSKEVLALIEPKAGRPKRWPEGRKVIEAMAEAGAALLTHLLPQEPEPRLVLTAPVDSITELLGEGPAMVSAVSELSPQASSLIERAGVAVRQGRWAEAGTLYAEAADGVPEAKRAEILLNLGAVEVQQGEPAKAKATLERAHGLFKASGDELGMAEASHNMGLAMLREGNGEAAVSRLKEARSLAGKASLRGLLDGVRVAEPARPSTPAAMLREAIRPAEEEMTVVLSERTPSIRAVAAREALISRATATDTDELAETLGTHDLELKLRTIDSGAGRTDLKLQTPAQERAENFQRTVSFATGAQPLILQWSAKEPLKAATLLSGLSGRVASKHLTGVGLTDRGEAALAVNLPQLYHFVLPLKIADCLHQLQRFEAAHEEYSRASRYELINLALEAPDLWRRMADNVLAWGDALYRAGDGQSALPVYELLLKQDTTPGSSLFYTSPSLSPVGTVVTNWLAALRAEQTLPELNPAIVAVLHSVRKRWVYLEAGLDFFGVPATVVSPFTFRYLQDVARYLAQRANNAEQRYIDFYARFENAQLTRKELENAEELAGLGIDLAEQNRVAANETVRAAQEATKLAGIRAANAQQQLTEFNNASWELETLAGHIARGSAWTGGDLPKLHYSAEGRYDIEGKKHEVLQELTRRQAAISNDLQRERMADAVAELNQGKVVAQAQQAVAQARAGAAQIEVQIANARADHASEMLDAFNGQVFNPEQWQAMALFMRWLASTALDQAIEVAQLMERAYNFENFVSRKVIRPSYKVSSTKDMLGAEWLLSDIDSFTHHQVTQVKEKPIPVKWGVSLAEEFPGQFLTFSRTGRLDFDVDLARVALAHPGTYRHRLAAVELEVDGFVPPMGVHGRLTSSGLGRHRGRDGSVSLRVQPAETLVLSRYSRRVDGALLSPPPDMRALFEGNSVGCGWSLEIPRSANDLDLRLVFDVRLVLYFDCLFDRDLYDVDSQPPAGSVFKRTRAIYLSQHQPDAFYQFKESGKAEISLSTADFPLNQGSPVLQGLSLAVVPAAGSAPLTGLPLSVSYPGTTAAAAVTVDSANLVPKGALPVTGTPSATGGYVLTAASHQEQIDDVVLVLDYEYSPV